MNPQLKAFLVVVVKQAVIGASTTVSVVWQDPANFNLTTRGGIEHVAVTILAAVASREALVWGPKLLAWANS